MARADCVDFWDWPMSEGRSVTVWVCVVRVRAAWDDEGGGESGLSGNAITRDRLSCCVLAMSDENVHQALTRVPDMSQCGCDCLSLILMHDYCTKCLRYQATFKGPPKSTVLYLLANRKISIARTKWDITWWAHICRDLGGLPKLKSSAHKVAWAARRRPTIQILKGTSKWRCCKLKYINS